MKNASCDISIIIPAYNEAGRIKQTLIEINRTLSVVDYSSEVLVIDDGSTDNTRGVVRQVKSDRIKLIGYPHNRGKGFAVNYGVMHAKGQFILFCDADNATPFEQIELLMNQMRDKVCDVAIASRHLKQSRISENQSAHRRLAAKFGNWLIQLLLLPGIADTQCGFKIFTRHAAKIIFTRQTIWGWGFDIELLYIARLHQLKIAEVPVRWINMSGSKLQSPLVFLQTLGELFRIKLKSVRGVYR